VSKWPFVAACCEFVSLSSAIRCWLEELSLSEVICREEDEDELRSCSRERERARDDKDKRDKEREREREKDREREKEKGRVRQKEKEKEHDKGLSERTDSSRGLFFVILGSLDVFIVVKLPLIPVPVLTFCKLPVAILIPILAIN